MDVSREDRIYELQQALVDRNPATWAAFLDVECADNPSLGAEVLRRQAQLEDDSDDHQWLAFAPPGADAELTAPASIEVIGPYRVLTVLGEGGMGIVYLAEQLNPIRRQVALKLIKVGMDTAEVVRRFDRERQALALMSHPNIAQVYDASATPEGRPYFVMEYVQGVPIIDFCDSRRYTVLQRLELFVDVCNAIQHAHQKGVIHRDLKPSNVLVTEQDGQPLVKVIDFGIAKAIDQRWAERATFTQGARVVGTPEYMSPEQAALSLDIDTTTDVYSLGVLLYELLVGLLPFDSLVLRAAGYDEMCRLIRECDPLRPSIRLVRAGPQSVTIAAERDTDINRLVRDVREDLDWIAMKALEKDRRCRYDSPAALAADIRRHLACEPVTARPPSMAYRSLKMLRRHVIVASAALAVVASVLAGLAIAVSMYIRAEQARASAVAQQREADQQRLEAERQRLEASRQRDAANSQRGLAERESQQAIAARTAADVQRDEAEYRAYVATIAAVDAHLRSGELLQAERRLIAVPQSMRSNWEWQYLWAQTDTSGHALVAREETAETTQLSKLALDANGRNLFLATNHLVQRWNVESAVPVTVLSTDRQILAMSDNASVVLTAVRPRSEPGARAEDLRQPLEVVDLATGGVVASIASARPSLAAFGAGGERVALESTAGVTVWDARTGTQLFASPRPLAFRGLAFSPEGSRVSQLNVVWEPSAGTRVEFKGMEPN